MLKNAWFVGAIGFAAGFISGAYLSAGSGQHLVLRAEKPLPLSPERNNGEAAGRELIRLALENANLVETMQSFASGAFSSNRPRDPELVDSVMSNLSDRDLEAALLSLMRLEKDDLAAIRDLRAFSKRLIAIALDDVMGPDSIPSADTQIFFGTEPGTNGPSDGTSEVFRAGAFPIYARFASVYSSGKVLVKWYRRDSPEILVLRQYPMSLSEPSGYVWYLPDQGWDPGRYRVDVYSGDEQLTLLASGQYTVR